MIINWLGMSCFKIQTKEATIVIDPYADKCGLKMPKIKADLVLISNKENKLSNNSARLSGDKFLIDTPGEYEKNQIFVVGLNAGETDQVKNTIYFMESEELTLGHLGLLNHSLSNAQLEIMEGADILFLPLTSLTPEKRSKVISQIEPRIIIPMEYEIPKVKLKLESLDKFLKEMGIKNQPLEEKVKITKKDLPAEGTKIIPLKSSV